MLRLPDNSPDIVPGNPPRCSLCYLLVEENDAADVGKPEGFAVRAFDNILGIAVGMDIDLDTGGAVANRAVHVRISYFFHVLLLLFYYKVPEKIVQAMIF
jgi:hypothetical protein